MKKSDLKTGMLIKLRCGDTRVILLDTQLEGDTTAKFNWNDHIGRLYDYWPLKYYNKDLTDNSNLGKRMDIMEVMDEFACVLWERPKEKPIVTLDGVDYSETTLRSLIKKATS